MCVCMHIVHVCMYVPKYVCMYVHMYVCMYVYVYVCVYIDHLHNSVTTQNLCFFRRNV
jgi:hypothetical protein